MSDEIVKEMGYESYEDLVADFHISNREELDHKIRMLMVKTFTRGHQISPQKVVETKVVKDDWNPTPQRSGWGL